MEIEQSVAPIGIMDDDAHCRDCGYNLRGLSRAGLCPECARPIADSLTDDRLSRSDVDWVMGVYWGAIAMLVSYVLRAALDLAEFWSVTRSPATVIALDQLCMAVGAFGVWRIAQREPNRRQSVPKRIGRLTANLYAIASIALVVIDRLEDEFPLVLDGPLLELMFRVCYFVGQLGCYMLFAQFGARFGKRGDLVITRGFIGLLLLTFTCDIVYLAYTILVILSRGVVPINVILALYNGLVVLFHAHALVVVILAVLFLWRLHIEMRLLPRLGRREAPDA